EQEFNAFADGILDGGKGLNRRQDAVKLAASMIGDYDCVGPQLRCQPRVVGIENTFKNELPLPMAPNPFDVRYNHRALIVALGPGGNIREVWFAGHEHREIAHGSFASKPAERPTRFC